MDGTREYYAKQNKSVKETQIPYDFTQMWNLRNKKYEQKEKKKRERKSKKQTLNYREQTGDYLRAGGRGMGIKECTCDEYRVLYVSVESLHWTPKTNITLYINN